MKLLTGKILIIADIHQNIGYAESCLQLESDFDYVVFLGDYFDTFLNPDGKTIYGIKDTCLWLNETYNKLGDRAVWLVGNHDIAYIATYNKNPTNTRPSSFYNCSGWTRSKATEFNKNINKNWFDSLELSVNCNGYIASHAGFNYQHFKPYISEIDNIHDLYNNWEIDKETFMHKPTYHWIWYVGLCRGGDMSVGSPVWLDWNNEFTPIDNISQIVGHTTTYSTDIRCKVGVNGLKNYCIDNMQQTYSIINNSEVKVKTIK